MAVFITPTNITPGTSDSWETVDVSSYIPSGSTGVILHIQDPGGTSGREMGWRKEGSSDNRIDEMGSDHFWTAVGCSTAREIELYIGNTTSPQIWLVGYFGEEAYFFTNAVDKTPGTLDSWQTVDISSDTGGDTATAGIFEAIQTAWGFGIRKYGSSDNRVSASGDHIGAMVGLDGSERCSAYLGDATPNQTVKLWLVGYMTAGFTSNTTATDVSLGSSGTWTDLSALPAGAIGGVIEVSGGNSGDEYGLRKNGSSENIYGYNPNTHVIGIVEADAGRIIEGKIYSTDIDFFVLGYFTRTTPHEIDVYDSTATTEGVIATTGTAVSVNAKAHILNTAQTVVARGYIGIEPTEYAYGIKITKPTYDVLTDPDPSHYIFDSRYGTLKYHISDTAQVYVTDQVGKTTIPHGLGYIPFVEIYTEDYDISGQWHYAPRYMSYSPTFLYKATYTVDETNIKLYVEGIFWVPTYINFMYFIFKNKLDFFDSTSPSASIYAQDTTIATDVITI